jgi:hypothetical protein
LNQNARILVDECRSHHEENFNLRHKYSSIIRLA